jgi:hypothetical protein
MYFDIIRRANSTLYAYMDLIAPATLNGHVYMCTTPGTSGSSPPTFNTAAGSTTSDGAVVWTECNPLGITYAAVCMFTPNPKYGDYRRGKKYVQPKRYSAGGDIYVYDKGLTARDTRTIKLTQLLPADLTKLLDFIEIVRGAKYAFNFYDETDVAHRALILNPDDISSEPERFNAETGPELELYLFT